MTARTKGETVYFYDRSKIRRTLKAAGFTEAKAKTIVDVTLTSIIRDDQWSKATKARKARRTLTAASFAKVKVEAIVDVMFEDPDEAYRANRYLLEKAGFDKAQAESLVDVLTEDRHKIHSRTLSESFFQDDAEAIVDALFVHGLQSEDNDPGSEGMNARRYLRNYGFKKAQAEAIVDALCLSTYGYKTDWPTSGLHQFRDRKDRVQEARRILNAAGFKEAQVEAIVDVVFEDPDEPYRHPYYRHLKEAGFDEAQTKAIVGLLHYVFRSLFHDRPSYFWGTVYLIACLILGYIMIKWIWGLL